MPLAHFRRRQRRACRNRLTPRRGRSRRNFRQAKPKSGQTEQNPAKPQQRKSKKDGWISLVSLVHFEPFQRVTATPQAKNPFGPPRAAPLRAGRGSSGDEGRIASDSVFRKEKVNSRALPGRDRALAQAGSPVDPRAPAVVSCSQFNAIDGFAFHFPPQWIAYRLFRAIIMRSRRVGPGVGRPSHVC